ncbi:MAG: hypothetical protein KJ067_23490 [Vicinamibacteria bacterium]|nr:hypothetical protein [Vicinamibacteria bacterium]
MSALPAYHLADEPDCDCLLLEEHIERCPGVPAPPLPNEVPVVTYGAVYRARQHRPRIDPPAKRRPGPVLRAHDYPRAKARAEGRTTR